MKEDPITATTMEQVHWLLRKGKEIEALALVIENSDLDMAEAENFIKRLQNDLR